MRNRFLEQVLRQREAEQVAALSEAKGKALPRDPGGRPRFAKRATVKPEPRDELLRTQEAIQRGDVRAAKASISKLETEQYLEIVRWCRTVGARFP